MKNAPQSADDQDKERYRSKELRLRDRRESRMGPFIVQHTRKNSKIMWVLVSDLDHSSISTSSARLFRP